jgi:thiamine-monophosphate kinase
LNESDERWLEDFARGLFALAEQHRVALIGGDLTRGPLCASLQIIGQIDSPGGPLRRAGAHVGDDIYVTGSLGDSAAGLTLMQSGSAQVTGPQQALISRFLKPTPRVAEGLALAGLASAAIDVSDGLLADLGHVCAASGVAAHVDVEQVPLSAELMALFPPQTAEGYALAGGDDYELCFTAAPAHAAAIAAVFERLGTALHRIGWVQAGSGVDCYRDGEVFEPARRGYQHFVA